MAHYLAIDADAGGLFVVAGTVKNGAAVVEQTAHAADAPTLSPSTAAALGVRLRDLLREAGIRPAPVLLCVGRDRVILKEVRHPPAPPAEEPAIVRFQAIRDLSESPDDVVMDYAPLPVGVAGERQAAVVFARKEVIAAAKALCEAAGLKLAAVTPRPFAVSDLLARAEEPAAPADAAFGLLTLWPTGGEFTVVRGRDVLFSRPIPPTAAADERALVGELRRNFTVYGGQRPADPLAAVYVAEPNNAREGWADRLGDVFPLPFRKLDPLAGTDAEVPDALRGRFAGPVGLLAAKAAADALPINFAAPRQPRAAANPHRARVLVAGLLAVLVAGSGVVLGYLELEKAGRRLAAATADREDVVAKLQALELEAKRLAAADEFANREVVWLDELYDLSHRVPDVAQVKVTEIDGTPVAPPARSNRPAPVLTGTNAAAPATPAAPKPPEKPTPAAQMRLVLTTENPAGIQDVTDSFTRDRFYAGTTKVASGQTSAGARGQQYTVTTQILHRSPADYRRKLTVTAPPKPADAQQGGFNGFGGGFPAFGGGFQ